MSFHRHIIHVREFFALSLSWQFLQKNAVLRLQQLIPLLLNFMIIHNEISPKPGLHQHPNLSNGSVIITKKYKHIKTL